MLIIRSLLLSFPILMRLTMIFPIMLVGYMVIGVIAVFLLLIMVAFSPPLAIFVVTALVVALGVFPVMLGIRLSCRQRGVEPVGTYGGMALQSMIYGLAEAFGILIIAAIIIGISYLVAPEMVSTLFTDFLPQDSGPQIITLNDPATPDTLPQLPGVLLIFAAIGIAAIAMRAVLLTPIAGGAVGRDPNGQAHTPFAHVGTYFFTSFLVTFLSFISTIIGYMAVPLIADVLGLSANLEDMFLNIEQGSYSNLGLDAVVLYIYIILLSLWVYAIQGAGALLIHIRLRDQITAYHLANTSNDHMTTQEARALWQSRM